MVSLLKQPVGNSKGILVFTHKERQFLLDPIPPLQRKFQSIKEAYLVGMHWGHFAEDVGPTPFVDFHLAGQGTVSFTDEVDVPVLNYCSRNFVPEYFTPSNKEAKWDIVTIAPPTRLKHLSELLNVVRETRDQGVDLTALFICPRPKSLQSRKWDHKFIETCENDLSKSEREAIKIIWPLRTDDEIYPIPHRIIPYFFNIANSFALFSEQEGESRVISEALMTGTPVIARSNLKGGGLDYLDNSNSLLFSSTEEAIEIFTKISNNPNEYAFDPDYLRDELYAPQSSKHFQAEVERVFNHYDIPYEGTLENEQLAFLLPGHALTLPTDLRASGVNDLRSQVAAVKFCEEVLEYPPKDNPVRLQYYRTREYFRDLLTSESITTQIGNLLWRVEQHTPINIYSRIQSIR
ncbi:hypothetical protein [Haladaptatus sp. DJG-WS-42]|uniref:hypothetical protein n=1 Tax=Haladaptatus sp. DJG-WS-42 TaxID=3120516 RepID=UPI0030D3ECA3